LSWKWSQQTDDTNRTPVCRRRTCVVIIRDFLSPSADLRHAARTILALVTGIVTISYFAPGSGCDVLWWLSPSVCLSVREDISGTTRATLTNIFVHTAYVCGSVLLRHIDDNVNHSVRYPGQSSFRLTVFVQTYTHPYAQQIDSNTWFANLP